MIILICLITNILTLIKWFLFCVYVLCLLTLGIVIIIFFYFYFGRLTKNDSFGVDFDFFSHDICAEIWLQ